MYSLGQAAKVAGVSKTTISNALKSGKLSYKEKTKSGYKIDPSELERVYPKRKVDDNSGRSVIPKEPHVNMGLDREVEVLREMIEELKLDRDRWQEQAVKITALLEDNREKPKGFWARIFG